MAVRIYLNTPTGQPLYGGANRLYIGDRLARLLALRFTAYASIRRLLALTLPLTVQQRSGYHLYAINQATGAETYLGFVSAAGPLTLAGVSLADGVYEVYARLSGYGWQNYRCISRFPLWISGGEIQTPLPAASAVAATFRYNDTLLTWTWNAQPGTVTPDDWAVWTSLTSPVDTSGAPTHVVSASGTGGYSQALAQGDAPLYVAVCSRLGATKGPLATLTIATPPADLVSPSNQRARD